MEFERVEHFSSQPESREPVRISKRIDTSVGGFGLTN